ncbi:hypothetical protein [Capnocytophaga gingivalis]|uniref:Immunity protein 12 domain-containing protein n=1 Tax=Capnocytophaga gingivalis TaxID=1017 RepID=A0ABU5YD41_9FLAO|nr:hypothetical protein [Capnocytophaga gingivalis]MEB3041877.1 hypothetical protein [Capnocytophaga gingivalis]
MVELESINIDGLKNVSKLKLNNSIPYFYDVELWIKEYDTISEGYILYVASICNIKGLSLQYSKRTLNLTKFYIFEEDMDYEKIFSFFNILVNNSKGRNIYETRILLQRYLEEQDLLFNSIEEYYCYLFDKIRGKR